MLIFLGSGLRWMLMSPEHIKWAQYLPAIREYKVGAWKYKEELPPYVGIRKRRTVVLERRVDKIAKEVIIIAIASHLGGLGMANSDAMRLANGAYDLAFGA
jgi:hypothetical protein